MLCSKCHKVVNDESQFCEYCGAQITDLSKEADLSTSKKDETAIKLGVLSGANKAVIALNRHFYIDDQRVDAKKILEYESLGIIEWEDDDKSKVIANLIINDESGRNNYESKDHQNISHKTPEASKIPEKLKNIFSEYSTVIWLSVVGIVLFSLLAMCLAPNNGKLIGRWTNIATGCTIIFSSDKTYDFLVPMQNDLYTKGGYSGDSGDYKISGNTIKLMLDNYPGEEVDYSFKLRDGILSLEHEGSNFRGIDLAKNGDYSK